MEKRAEDREDRLLADSKRRDEGEFETAKSALLRDILKVRDPVLRKDLIQQAQGAKGGQRALLNDIRAQLTDLGPEAQYDTVSLRQEVQRVDRLRERTMTLLRATSWDEATRHEWAEKIKAAKDTPELLDIQGKIPNPVKPGAISESSITAMLASGNPQEMERGEALRTKWMEVRTGMKQAILAVSSEAKAKLTTDQKTLMEEAVNTIVASRDEQGRLDDNVASQYESRMYMSGMKRGAVIPILRASGVLQQRDDDEAARKSARALDLHRDKALATQAVLQDARKAQGEQGVALIHEALETVNASKTAAGSPNPDVVTEVIARLGAAKVPTQVINTFRTAVGFDASQAALKLEAQLPVRVAQAEQVLGARLDASDQQFARREGLRFQKELLTQVKGQPDDAGREALMSKILAVDIYKDPTAPSQLLALSTQVQGPIGTKNRLAFAVEFAAVSMKEKNGEPLNQRDKQTLMAAKVYRDVLDTNLTSTEMLARVTEAKQRQAQGLPPQDDDAKYMEMYRRYTMELNPSSLRLIAGQISDDPDTAIQAEVMRRMEVKQLGENVAERARQEFLHGPIGVQTQERLVRLTETKMSLQQLASFSTKEREQFVGVLQRPAEQTKSYLRDAARTLGLSESEASKRYQTFNVALNQVMLVSAFVEGGKQLTEHESRITFGFVPTGKEPPAEFAAKLVLNMSRIDYLTDMNLAMASAMKRDLAKFGDFVDTTIDANRSKYGLYDVFRMPRPSTQSVPQGTTQPQRPPSATPQSTPPPRPPSQGSGLGSRRTLAPETP